MGLKVFAYSIEFKALGVKGLGIRVVGARVFMYKVLSIRG